MTVLSINKAQKFFGARCLFEDITFTVGDGEKVALIGRNGEGKTTLLKIIAGQMDYDGGDVVRVGARSCGYLTQDPQFTPGNSLRDELAAVFTRQRQMEAELRRLEAEMAKPEVYSDQAALARTMEDYSRRSLEFEAAGGYEYETKIRTTLMGLGFAEEELSLPLTALSGGQKVRAGLARLLLESPDLLLLDEPTNHLDIEATEWLEEYLRVYKGGVLIVSHDRYFLDRIVSKVVEIEDRRSYVYQGNYSAHLRQKEERLRLQMAEYERQQEEIAHLESFIDRFRAQANFRYMVRSRINKLERMDLVDKPRLHRKAMGVSFAAGRSIGKEVLNLDGMGREFDGRTLFRDFTATIFNGDRVALVGRNGAGKTTFLRIVTGRLEPSWGDYAWAENVDIAYFSQDLDDLDDENTLFDEILTCGDMTNTEVRSLLGRFLFTGEDVFKKVSTLSGGERNRLTLAKLVISGANVLILDEPTNHLDLASKQALEQALAEFPGTILLVSHDRYFIDQVATRVLEFNDGSILSFPGNYTAYRNELARLAALLAAGRQIPAQMAQRPDIRKLAGLPSRPADTDRGPDQPGRRGRELTDRAGPGAGEQQAVTKARRQLTEQRMAVEAEIERLEAEKHELEGLFAGGEAYRNGGEPVRRYGEISDRLAELYRLWEEIVETGS
ncbi:MAG: ABC-F family ATP-binding cassette domain-containing protein [Chloroflexota bacterium]